ncbi:hypothetical protein M9Y10_008488 [Tritrichomonas musculus]|uniref:Uncharacterized protein n=1 Tax=Tritrichomonas musculus TaxID=1915356 RepID=A0ABR2IZ09_9EUKA
MASIYTYTSNLPLRPFLETQTDKFYENISLTKVNLDISSLLSISSKGNFAVIIKKDRKAFCIGDNSMCQIHSFLPHNYFKSFTELIINNSENRPFQFISAVCGENYTLYHLYDEKEGHKICMALYKKNTIFLDIDDLIPIALFGGTSNSAFVDSLGGVTIIITEMDRFRLQKRFTLPNLIKPVKVALGLHSVLILGSDNHIYACKLNDTTNLQFSIFDEREYIDLSGEHDQFLALSMHGKAYCYGLNDSCQFGFENKRYYQEHPIFKQKKKISKEKIIQKFLFELVTKMENVFVRSVFAARGFSYFFSNDGKVYMIGDGDPNPREIDIKDVAFCIVGYAPIFLTGNEIPENLPNKLISDLNKFNIDQNKLIKLKMISKKENERNMLLSEIEKLHEKEKELKAKIDKLSKEIQLLKS